MVPTELCENICDNLECDKHTYNEIKSINQVTKNNINNVIPKIINLSSYDLTNAEITVLSKGLKFCPTPMKKDLLNLEIEIKEFIRKIELITEFSENNENSDTDCLVQRKGNYIPKDTNDPLLISIKTQIKSLAENLGSIDTPTTHNNITHEERDAIYKLRDNEDIIIKSADKGGSIIIMDRQYYINKVNECLNNSEVYSKLTKNPDTKIFHSIKNLANKYKDCFDKKKKEIQYISNFDFKTANFYGLPKIHKSKVIQTEMEKCNNIYVKITENLDLPFRFITGGPICPTSRLSELLDILLKPYYCKIKSYIRDSTDLLNKLPKFTGEEINDIIIITCDIKDMYSNITLNLGIKAIRYWISKYPELLHKRYNIDFVIEALEFVLKNATFQFNDEYYTLIKGTVTGTKVAPTYANLTMAFLEIEFYRKVKEKFGENIHNYVFNQWKRFLDDGLMIWKKSFGNFEDFILILNNLDSNIEFTYDSSDYGLSYLNLFIYIESNKLLTDVYYKPTDSHDYLPFSSCHPRHTKNNIPENLARIICTIVDDQDRKQYRLTELKSWLKRSGYPIKLINNAFYKVSKIDKMTLRTKALLKDQKLLVFVQTHNPKNPQIFGNLLESFNFLIASKKFANIFKDLKFIKSERQPRNL